MLNKSPSNVLNILGGCFNIVAGPVLERWCSPWGIPKIAPCQTQCKHMPNICLNEHSSESIHNRSAHHLPSHHNHTYTKTLFLRLTDGSNENSPEQRAKSNADPRHYMAFLILDSHYENKEHVSLCRVKHLPSQQISKKRTRMFNKSWHVRKRMIRKCKLTPKKQYSVF